jgi:hypothetical protein
MQNYCTHRSTMHWFCDSLHEEKVVQQWQQAP